MPVSIAPAASPLPYRRVSRSKAHFWRRDSFWRGLFWYCLELVKSTCFKPSNIVDMPRYVHKRSCRCHRIKLNTDLQFAVNTKQWIKINLLNRFWCTRAVKGIDGDVKLNRALWVMAENMLQLASWSLPLFSLNAFPKIRKGFSF